MHSHNSTSIGRDLRDRVLGRLGFSTAPAANLGGLSILYRAWCANVPFDNVRKMIALRAGETQPLPGGSATEFFENWLADGAGGTCWPTSNALFELVSSLGFKAHRITGAMRDLGIANHASVKVATGDSEWLVDSSMLTIVPLPLGREIFIQQDDVCAVEVEPVDGSHIVWCDMPPNTEYLPCRLHVDPVDESDYLEAYEKSRERSPFNQRLYARRNLSDEVLVLVGNTRWSKTRGGLQNRDLTREEVLNALRADIGLSAALVDQWVRSGALEASFEPPAGPKPPRIARRPPSRRSAT